MVIAIYQGELSVNSGIEIKEILDEQIYALST